MKLKELQLRKSKLKSHFKSFELETNASQSLFVYCQTELKSIKEIKLNKWQYYYIATVMMSEIV